MGRRTTKILLTILGSVDQAEQAAKARCETVGRIEFASPGRARVVAYLTKDDAIRWLSEDADFNREPIAGSLMDFDWKGMPGGSL